MEMHSHHPMEAGGGDIAVSSGNLRFMSAHVCISSVINGTSFVNSLFRKTMG